MTDETETKTKDITVQGITIPVSQPFYEGYVLKAADAHVLNQTYAENIRNNVAGIVRDAKAEAAKAAGFLTKDKDGNEVGDPEQAPIDDMDLDALRAKIAAYEDDYEFAVGNRGPRAPADPVAREALNIAKDRIKAAYKAKYPDKKLPAATDITAAATKLLDSGNATAVDIKAEATRRVEMAKSSAVDLGDIEL
jgi:hypothetical protein